MTSEKILKAKFCGDIFTNDEAIAKKEYRELSKKFHPDVNHTKDATLVFSIVSDLYSKAENNFKNNTWECTDRVILSFSNNGKVEIKPSYTISFELGIVYFTKEKVIYIVDKSYKKYYDNYKKRVDSLTYKDDNMKKEFERYFPQKVEEKVLTNGSLCYIINKSQDVVPLQQVIENEQSISVEHLAWMVSRLMNICCFNTLSGISHNGISIESLLISPTHHTVLLFGGWWYASKNGEKMIGTNKTIYSIMSNKSKTDKISATQTDIESIKYLARTLPTIQTNKEILDWSWSGSTDDAFKEFTIWNAVLEKAFGKRKFVEWKLNFNKYYK